MATMIGQMMHKLHRQIKEQDYYQGTYVRALMDSGMDYEGIEHGCYEDHRLVDMCHRFWLYLPDSSAIRRGPFFLLCDIAEHVFDDDDTLGPRVNGFEQEAEGEA